MLEERRKYRQRMPASEDTTADEGQALVTPGFLRFVGELLFGERWQTPLALELGNARGKLLAPATVHRWITQTRSIPDWVVDALAVALERGERDLEHRAKMARQVARRIRSPAPNGDFVPMGREHDRGNNDAFG